MLVIYVCLFVAVSLLVESTTSGSVFAQGTTECDAAEASKEAQTIAERLELISTIQRFLN